MISEQGKKFIIETKYFGNILRNIYSNTSNDPEASLIMDNQIMTRTIYQLPSTPQSNKHQWLRIRVGDLDCEGNSKCTITFKRKTLDSAKPKSAKLEVDNYYDAIHMFDLLGFKKTSTQETKRTKIVCFYESVKYLVCFDIWPWIEEITFITIEAGPNAEQLDFEGFLDLIDIEKYKLNKVCIDVDSEYKNRYNRTASDIPVLKFDFPIDNN